MKSFGRNLILALATWSVLFPGSQGVMAQGPQNEQPDMTIDAATRTAVIDGT